MQIRHKLLLWFTGLVSVLLLAFSTYIYLSYAEFRTKGFTQRLSRKVKLLPQVLDDAHMQVALATLPEQAGYVYDPDNQSIYTSKEKADFQPSIEFLARVRQRHKVAFEYESDDHRFPKSGLAHTFKRHGQHGKYIAIVTAYNHAGFAQQRRLGQSLLYGYLGAASLERVMNL